MMKWIIDKVSVLFRKPKKQQPKTIQMTATVTPAEVDALTFTLVRPDGTSSAQNATTSGSGTVSVNFTIPSGTPVLTYQCKVQGQGMSDSTSITC